MESFAESYLKDFTRSSLTKNASSFSTMAGIHNQSLSFEYIDTKFDSKQLGHSISSPKERSLINHRDSLETRTTQNLQRELASNANLKEELLTKINTVSAENEKLMAELQEMTRLKYDLKTLSQETKFTIQNQGSVTLELAIKQRDFFHAEYKKIQQALQKQEALAAAKIENEIIANELKRELSFLKSSHQGEIKRLHQTISTIQLENEGLKNLRTVLEGQLESLKNVKREHADMKSKVAQMERENTGLRSKLQAVNQALEARTEEFNRAELEFNTHLREADQEIQEIRAQIGEAMNLGNMKAVLFSIENERLWNVINSLQGKIQVLEQSQREKSHEYEIELENIKTTAENQISSFVLRNKELETRLREIESLNKIIAEKNEKLLFENNEQQKELEHWKERYRMLEGSHKYLADAVDKMGYTEAIDLNISFVSENGIQKEKGVYMDPNLLVKEVNFFKEKVFSLEKQIVLLMIEIERMQTLLISKQQQTETLSTSTSSTQILP